MQLGGSALAFHVRDLGFNLQYCLQNGAMHSPFAGKITGALLD